MPSALIKITTPFPLIYYLAERQAIGVSLASATADSRQRDLVLGVAGIDVVSTAPEGSWRVGGGAGLGHALGRGSDEGGEEGL